MAKIARFPLGRIGIAFIALGVLAGVLFFQTPGETASGPSEPPDSDGRVPIKRVCYHEESKQAFTLRRVWRHEDPVRVEATIFVDVCELRDWGAGPQDVKNFIKHEKGHANGFMHYQGDPRTNPSYYPQIVITGR